MADVEIIDVVVAAEVQVVEVHVAAEVQIVEVITVGPQGPAGPAGPSGQAVVIRHVQSSPAAAWTINHNLGRFPLVETYTVGGLRMLAGVLNLSPNICRIEFDEPTAGTAILI